MPVRYILSSVWVRLSIFSQLPIIQYVGLCVFSLLISPVMIERLYTLSFYHHQIGSMNDYPLFMVRSWNNGVRCMSFYILLNMENDEDKCFIVNLGLIIASEMSGISCCASNSIKWQRDVYLKGKTMLGFNFATTMTGLRHLNMFGFQLTCESSEKYIDNRKYRP